MSVPENIQIPEFDSEDQEREFWADHDSTDYVDWSKALQASFGSLKSTSEVGSAQLPVDLLRRLVEATLRPKCRILQLAIFRDDPEAGISDKPFADINEIHPPLWITVYYQLEEISSTEAASGSVQMYVDADGHATHVLGVELLVAPFEREFAGAIVDMLLAAIEYCEGARA